MNYFLSAHWLKTTKPKESKIEKPQKTETFSCSEAKNNDPDRRRRSRNLYSKFKHPDS